MSQAAGSKGLFKELGDKLRDYPNSRCDSIPQCVGLVKSGLHVYISVRAQSLFSPVVIYINRTETTLYEGKRCVSTESFGR